MRKAIALATTVFALFHFAGIASAGVGITPRIGTLGYGGDLTVGLVKTLNARVGVNLFNYEIERSEENGDGSSDDISVKIDFENFPAVLDWHPWNSGFRISAGAIFNNNEVELYAKPGDTITFYGNDYSISRVDGLVSFEKVCPYIGIGSGNAADRSSRWHFACDIGVMFQGSPEIALTATASDPMFQAALDRDVEEKRKEIEDDVEAFTLYPVVALGVSFTF